MITQKKRIFHLMLFLEDKKDHTLNECRQHLAIKFNLSENQKNEKQQKIKSSSTNKPRKKFDARIADDVSILKGRKHLQHSRKAVFHITELGLIHLSRLKSINKD